VSNQGSIKYIMKQQFLLILLIVCSFSVKLTQAQDSTRLSLQTALENAVSHRLEIRIQQSNAAHSANEVSKIGSRFLPQLNSDLSVQYNSQLQTVILPGTAFGLAGTPSKRVRFGTAYNTTADLNLVIPIYNAADYSDQKIAKSQATYDQMNVQKTIIDIREEVTDSYFNALISKKKLDLSKINFDNTLAVFTMAKTQLIQGAITSYDLNKNNIDFQNAKSDYTRNVNSYQLALVDLIYRTGLDSVSKLVLSDDLNKLFAEYNQNFSTVHQQDRIEVQMQGLQTLIYKQNMSRQNKGYLPVFSAYSNYTAQNLNKTFTPFNAGTWYPYNYIGLKASIPVFDGFLKHRTRRGYEILVQSSELLKQKLIRDYHQDVLNAEISMRNDQQDLGNQQNNLSLALELYKIDSDRYRKGTIKQTDLAASYYTLQQTQNNYLNAMYTYLIEVVQYKKAQGSL